MEHLNIFKTDKFTKFDEKKKNTENVTGNAKMGNLINEIKFRKSGLDHFPGFISKIGFRKSLYQHDDTSLQVQLQFEHYPVRNTRV